MDIKKYRELKGLTQPQLAKELQEVCAGIDAPLISKIEKGLCLPSAEVQAYIDAKAQSVETQIADLTPTQTDILFRVMTATREYPVDRHELGLLCGKSDRMVRKDIQVMRDMGIRICSNSNGYGYWLAKGETDYKMFRAEMMSRAMAHLKTVSMMDKNCEGQIRLHG